MTRLAILPLAAITLAAGAPAPDTSSITVTVTNLRNAEGVVRACMTTAAKSFPKCRGVEGAHATTVNAKEGSITLTFEGVKPGNYAIALLHDENANGKADRVLGMMPKEGFGFSRDAPVRMGPPTFDQAAFEYAGEAKAMTIRMRYLL